MKVKALIRFKDLKENIERQIGDEFVISKERYDEILTNGGEWIKEVEDKKGK